MRKIEHQNKIRPPKPDDVLDKSELKKLRETKIQQDLNHIRRKLKIIQDRGE